MLPEQDRVELYYGECVVAKHGVGTWRGGGKDSGLVISGVWERNVLKEKRKVKLPGFHESDIISPPLSPTLSPRNVSPRTGSTTVVKVSPAASLKLFP